MCSSFLLAVLSGFMLIVFSHYILVLSFYILFACFICVSEAWSQLHVCPICDGGFPWGQWLDVLKVIPCFLSFSVKHGFCLLLYQLSDSLFYVLCCETQFLFVTLPSKWFLVLCPFFVVKLHFCLLICHPAKGFGCYGLEYTGHWIWQNTLYLNSKTHWYIIKKFSMCSAQQIKYEQQTHK